MTSRTDMLAYAEKNGIPVPAVGGRPMRWGGLGEGVGLG